MYKVLFEDDFIKDQINYFRIFPKVLKNKYECISDDENYFICKLSDFSIYIWNKDGINDYVKKEIIDNTLDLVDGLVKEIVCKKEIYDDLKNSVNKDDFIIDSGINYTYVCNDIIYDDTIIGRKVNARIDDAFLIKCFVKNDITELYGSEFANSYSDSFYYYQAMARIHDPNFYLWQVNGQKVAMATYEVARDYGVINSVYTDKNYRGNGYAKMLINSICEEIKRDDLVPLLYVDGNNKKAIYVYENVGFEKENQLYKICLKEKGKVRKINYN